MAANAIPNPKKSTQVDFPIEKVKLSVQNISLRNNKYKFYKSNEIFNQYTFESSEFLSLGVYVDINLNKITEDKTEITVEIRRKIGTFNQSYEIINANEHIEKTFECIAFLITKSPEEIEQYKVSQTVQKVSSKSNHNSKNNFENGLEKPWYEKTGLVILLCVLFFPVGLYALWKNSTISKFWKYGITSLLAIIIVVNCGDDKTDKNATTENATTENVTEENETVTNEKSEKSETVSDLEILKTKLKNNIKSLENDDLTNSPLKSAQDFTIAVALFKAYAITINEAKPNKDKEVQSLISELEKKVIKSQIKNFPKLRKAYFEFLKEKLWENDIDVSISGSNNQRLSFTASYFAANKNIKETQEALSEMLHYLHFKRTQYQWYKGQDEFTYYDIESDNDNEIKTE
ncbi:hypothetical protein FLACOL_01303 [Flavobacterium columnare]|uniref:Uncharacterized protein n=2 Tax=Flavobacterium TaxID=237 RepID=A0ABW8PLW5_9FLAO|nr:hypothetical protein [Flavobacterium columnare]SPE77310.1 hypothetical protein FLACOL_01303 [Flavobacterium columnare]